MIFLQLLWYCTKQVLFILKNNGRSQIDSLQFVLISLSFVLQRVHLLLVELVVRYANCSIVIDGEVSFPFSILTGDIEDADECKIIRRFFTNVFEINSLEMSR